jgi:uncharacterized membrane protein
MLITISAVLVLTLLSVAVSAGHFFLMKRTDRALAFVVHHVLACCVGLCFVAAALVLQGRDDVSEMQSLLLLGVGVAMLTIHVVKLSLEVLKERFSRQ